MCIAVEAVRDCTGFARWHDAEATKRRPESDTRKFLSSCFSWQVGTISNSYWRVERRMLFRSVAFAGNNDAVGQFGSEVRRLMSSLTSGRLAESVDGRVRP